jgi:hypothetical protein
LISPRYDVCRRDHNGITESRKRPGLGRYPADPNHPIRIRSGIEGYAAGEILGRNFSILFIPEDAREGKPQRHLTRAREEGRLVDEGLEGSTQRGPLLGSSVRDDRMEEGEVGC